MIQTTCIGLINKSCFYEERQIPFLAYFRCSFIKETGGINQTELSYDLRRNNNAVN